MFFSLSAALSFDESFLSSFVNAGVKIGNLCSGSVFPFSSLFDQIRAKTAPPPFALCRFG